jgi:integrase
MTPGDPQSPPAPANRELEAPSVGIAKPIGPELLLRPRPAHKYPAPLGICACQDLCCAGYCDAGCVQHQRAEGLIGPKGREGKYYGSRGKKVKAETVRYDLKFLNAVLNWATVSGLGDGSSFLERNPLKGLKYPKVTDAVRHIMPQSEYDKLLAAAQSEQDWRLKFALVLAHETGHRIGSIRHLRWSDIDFEEATVHWRAEYDKQNYDYHTPLTQAALEALREAREHHPGIGEAWVFPAPQNSAEPSSRYHFERLFKRGVTLAKLPKVKGRGWHSFRRKLATDMLDRKLELRHLMDMGGWRDPLTVVKSYQRSSMEKMREELELRGLGVRKSG